MSHFFQLQYFIGHFHCPFLPSVIIGILKPLVRLTAITAFQAPNCSKHTLPAPDCWLGCTKVSSSHILA